VCRHLAWVGQSRSLAELVLEPAHGLLTQSYAPRRQRHGRLNADGWGVGFYPPGQQQPVRWRSSRPLWSDASFASVAPVLSSTCVLAAVRSASEGMPVEESATAPFTHGRWLLSHNGRVDRAVLPALPDAESTCDSALLAAHVFARGAERVGRTILDVADDDPAARLTLLLTDGTRVLGATWGDTLCYLVTEVGVVVASEPYDDRSGWVEVPDRHLVQAGPHRVSVTPLEAAA